MDGFISPIYDDLRLELKQKKWWKPIQGRARRAQKRFYHSLCAAFTPEEISGQCSAAGLQELHVETFGDRHVLIYGRLDSTE